MKYTTLFLDRDGVLFHPPANDDYIKSVSEVHWLPGVFEAMEMLNGVFRRIFVITNQRGIARGVLTEADLQAIHAYMRSYITIDKVYYCPHEKRTCECRKPLPGLAYQAQRDFPDIKFKESIVAGDSVTDMNLARNIDATGYMIDSRFTLLDFAKQIRSIA